MVGLAHGVIGHYALLVVILVSNIEQGNAITQNHNMVVWNATNNLHWETPLNMFNVMNEDVQVCVFQLKYFTLTS